jgi:pentapeptide MXKDX repeat protein
MRKVILGAVCAVTLGAFTGGAAVAQTSGPAGQDSTKMGTGTNMSNDNMAKTQGMSKDSMHKSAAHKSMKKDKAMKSDGMQK